MNLIIPPPMDLIVPPLLFYKYCFDIKSPPHGWYAIKRKAKYKTNNLQKNIVKCMASSN